MKYIKKYEGKIENIQDCKLSILKFVKILRELFLKHFGIKIKFKEDDNQYHEDNRYNIHYIQNLTGSNKQICTLSIVDGHVMGSQTQNSNKKININFTRYLAANVDMKENGTLTTLLNQMKTSFENLQQTYSSLALAAQFKDKEECKIE